jgi:hypothetical protein
MIPTPTNGNGLLPPAYRKVIGSFLIEVELADAFSNRAGRVPKTSRSFQIQIDHIRQYLSDRHFD